MNRIYDPRGKQRRSVLELAPRSNTEILKKGSVLFFDNTKLSGGCYHRIFPKIKEGLSDQGITRWMDVKESVRGKSHGDLNQLAEKLTSYKPTGVISALADVGVSPAMVHLTIALEQRGIPTVCLTASPGHELAESVAHYHAGRLCLCQLDIKTDRSVGEIESEVNRKLPQMIKGLTLPSDQIDAFCQIHFPIDLVTPSEDGQIEVRTHDGNGQTTPETAERMDEISDLFESLRIGDGLPVIPPTTERVDKILEFWPGDPEEILFSGIGPAGVDVTVFDVSVSSVMAGCRPEYLPIVVTALKAMAAPSYNLIQAVTTTHPGGNLVLVSGPLASELGIQGGQGCLGPGFRANATIGRAVNLVFINVCRAVPGVSDLACQSSPAEFTYCFAEDPTLTPWKTINTERFDPGTTVVLVLKAEGPHAVMDFSSRTADDLLITISDCCSTLGSNNAYVPGNLILVLTPDHAQILNEGGYDKDGIRKHIHECAGFPVSRLLNRGIVATGPTQASALDNPCHPITRATSDVEIVVAGGRGGHSQVILPWALHSEAVVLPVRLPDGRHAERIEAFRWD